MAILDNVAIWTMKLRLAIELVQRTQISVKRDPTDEVIQIQAQRAVLALGKLRNELTEYLESVSQ